MAYQEPDFLPWDGRRVPLTFIGGYLGAGKTTAINQLLAETDRPIAVLVNDVGEINIDAALVKQRHGDTLELTDGCVCCSLIDGFGAAFDQIRARPEPPDHVVVELSGAADPERMLPWGESAGFVLDGVIVVVAADQLVTDQIEGLDLPARARTAINAQVGKADLLVLTKTDLVSADNVRAAHDRLGELAPGVPVFVPDDAAASGAASGRFLSLGGRRPSGSDFVAAPSLFDAHEVQTVPLAPSDSLAALEQRVADIVAHAERDGASVVRAKGITATADDRLYLIQVVGRRTSIEPLPMAEFSAPTDLTVITLPPR